MKSVTTRLLFALILIRPIVVFAAPTVTELTELFMPAQLSDAKMSPDGANLGFIARRGDIYAIGVFNFATRQMHFSGGDGKIRPIAFWWKGPNRLLIETSTYKLNALGFTALDADGKNPEDLWRLSEQPGLLFDALPADPRHVLMSTREEIVKVNIDSEDRERISGTLERVQAWVVDELGRPRAAMNENYHFGSLTQWWRTSPTGAWHYQKYEAADKRFYPQAVAEDGRFLFGWEFSPDTDLTIARQDTTTGKVEALSRQEGLDPTTLLLLGRTRRPIAVAYEQGRDVKLVALSDSVAPAIERLQKHFTGFYSRIVDELPDGKSWLVWVGNSRLPGAYIVFNHETSESYVLALTHDQALKEDRLTPAEYFSFPGRNGGRLSARLWRPQNIQLPPLIVFCPEELPANIVRSVFQSKVQAFVKQGYAVLQINPRNSWGFGKDRRQQAENDWIRALQEDLDDAVEELVVKKVVNGSQVCLYGDNFGGVLALQVAALSKRFAAVATVNVPANLHRDDLGSVTNVVGSNPLVAKLGGWRESEKFAQKLSPTLIAPVLTIPALYLHDDESLKGRPIQDGREIRSALKNAKAAAEIGLAFSWSQYFKPPSQLARENAEISMKITSFFNRSASGVLR